MPDPRSAALSPKPAVCLDEPIIREGLLAADRWLFQSRPGVSPKVLEADLDAIRRAVDLVKHRRWLDKTACVSRDAVETRATIDGLLDEVVGLRSALRRSESALEEALRG